MMNEIDSDECMINCRFQNIVANEKTRNATLLAHINSGCLPSSLMICVQNFE
jgi:hypothetical protein